MNSNYLMTENVSYRSSVTNSNFFSFSALEE